MGDAARPFFPWVGGKEKLAPYIRQVFPSHITQYTEVFGGSGAILLGMAPKKGRLDIYNDLDRNLANLFLCVQERPVALIAELRRRSIQSRTIFKLNQELLKHEELHRAFFDCTIRMELDALADRNLFLEQEVEQLRQMVEGRKDLFNVQRAAMFLQNIRGSFSGTAKSFGIKPLQTESCIPLIEAASKRLEHTVVECKDCIQIIRDEDGDANLFYCDPPYFQAEKHYQAFRQRDVRRFHVRLWRALLACRSYVAVSYNDCPFIRQLYRDFYLLAFRRPNSLSQKQGSEYKELLITNYDPRPFLNRQLGLFDGQLDAWELDVVHVPKRSLKIMS